MTDELSLNNAAEYSSLLLTFICRSDYFSKVKQCKLHKLTRRLV